MPDLDNVIKGELQELTRRVNGINNTGDLITMKQYVDSLIENLKHQISSLESESQATIKAMRHEINGRLTSNHEEMDRRFQAYERETALALSSLKEHLAVMNEFRAAIDDILETVVKKSECILIQNKLNETLYTLMRKVESLELTRAEMQGKASVEDLAAVRSDAAKARLIGQLSLAIAALSLIAAVILAVLIH